MQNKKHILSQNGKHHKKKILLLATLIPLGFLATGGAVIGGMAIAKVGPFADASKTDINTIFSVNDGTKDINTDVEPYISDGDTTKVHDYMWAFLNNIASTTYDGGSCRTVMNDLTVPTLSSISAGWNSIEISVNSHSQKYDGSNFMLRLFVALSGRTLAMDFPSAGRDLDIPNDTNLADFNTASYANVTQLQIRDIITSLTENSNLNKNQINIAYGPDKDSLTTITSDIGPNQASLVNNAWSVTNDNWDLWVQPIVGGIYNGQDALHFTLEMYRPQLSADSNWPATKTFSYVVAPDSEQLEVSFRETYGDYGTTKASWWDNSFGFIGGTSDGFNNWSFILYSGTARLSFEGTPWYKSIANSDGSQIDYNFTYTSTDQIRLDNAFGANRPVTTQTFYQTPIYVDVYLKLIGIQSSWSSLYWGQIGINIIGTSSGSITIQPVAGSKNYTANSGWTFNWTLAS